jgi:hypothetical protein
VKEASLRKKNIPCFLSNEVSRFKNRYKVKGTLWGQGPPVVEEKTREGNQELNAIETTLYTCMKIS